MDQYAFDFAPDWTSILVFPLGVVSGSAAENMTASFPKNVYADVSNKGLLCFYIETHTGSALFQ